MKEVVIKLRQDVMNMNLWHPHESSDLSIRFFHFLNKERITLEDFQDILDTKFSICLEEFPDAPIRNSIEIRSEHFYWKDTANKRYCGLRKNHLGYYSIKAFSCKVTLLLDRLFDRVPDRKQYDRVK